MKSRLQSIVTTVAVVFLAACAEKGPVLMDNIRYQAPEGLAASAPRAIVGVSPFKDDRGKTISIIGKRTIREDIENELVVQGTVSDLVAKALKDALTARGIKVKDVPAWDLSTESIKAEGVDILIGGEIKTLWVEAASRPLNVKIRAEVKLRVSSADAAEKKIFRTLDLNSALERQEVAFSFASVEATLSEALSAALDQLLNDSELKAKIK